MKAELVKIKTERRLPDPPIFIVKVLVSGHKAHVLLCMEDGSRGPAIFSLFGDHRIFPEIRRAWRIFINSDIKMGDEWSLSGLARAFVRWINRPAGINAKL